MKKIKFILFLLCINFIANAQQNMVPNPSFEDTINGCPNNISQINKSKFWFRTNVTPDYYNRCYTGPFNYCIVPNSSAGYQQPNNASCDAYAGVFTSFSGGNNTNETFSIKFNDSLIIGQKYFFSFKTSLANGYKHASNNLGILLTTKSPSISLTNSPTNFCQVNFSQVITDTLNWTNLFKSYTADSNYKYISLGNFKDSSLTTKVVVKPSGFLGSYYFIDDVCISTDSAFAYNYLYNCTLTSLSDHDYVRNNFEIFPNPSSGFVYIKNKDNLQIRVSLFDFQNKEFKININRDVVDLSFLQNGIYFIEITSGQNRIRKKMIKQN